MKLIAECDEKNAKFELFFNEKLYIEKWQLTDYGAKADGESIILQLENEYGDMLEQIMGDELYEALSNISEFAYSFLKAFYID